MELLFDKDGNGQAEITKVLGFLSSDFKYSRLKTDIKLVTPDLINFISEDVYNKIVDYYKKDTPTATEKKQYQEVLELAQFYIGVMAYYGFAGNNDLMHTTAGRKMNKAEDETTPWDWQIETDDAALLKKAYKALDQLIVFLDKSKINEWLTSDAYKKSKALFVHNTTLFNERYPINNSAQLYFRLVPFMADFETVEIESRVPEPICTRLKESIVNPSETTPLNKLEKQLLINIEYAVVYLTLAEAYNVFPIEMFPDKINYREKAKGQSQARAEVMLKIKDKAKHYLLKIEDNIAKINESLHPTPTQANQTPDLLPGLKQGTKYVDL